MAVEPPRTKNDLFLRAVRGEQVSRTPVWAMRQAGRWDPEFQRIRAGMGFYEFSENAELAAQASLCPLRFGVDAIILFYDITTLSVAMGQKFALVAERGPVPEKPIRTLADVQGLGSSPAGPALDAVVETLRIVRRELSDELPVLVFAGAPFTLATYQIGTGKDVDRTRAFAVEQPEVWNALLDRIGGATVGFLETLMREGAAAYQLFDSWAGALTRDEYSKWAQPHHQRVFGSAPGASILFVKDGPYLDQMATSGAKVLSLGKQHELAAVRLDYPHLAVQGNVDHELLIHGQPSDIRAATERCLKAGGGTRHILNLDHGMDRAAKVENFEAFVRTAREFRQ